MTPFYHESIPNVPGVYRILCTTNKKFYIGSSIDLQRRRRDHFNELHQDIHYNPKLQRAFNKYGEESFVFEILEYVLLPELLTAREQWWLDKLKPFGNKGFNIALNAQAPSLGRSHTLEARKKIAAWHLGRPSPHKGGYKASAVTRERLRISHLGQIPHSLGKKYSSETCEKIRIGKSKTFIITAPDGTEYIALGLKAFCQEHGVNVSGLARVVRGQQSHHKGWKAQYFEKDDEAS